MIKTYDVNKALISLELQILSLDPNKLKLLSNKLTASSSLPKENECN